MTTAISPFPAPTIKLDGSRWPDGLTGATATVIELHPARRPGHADCATVAVLGRRRVVSLAYADVQPIPPTSDGREFMNAVVGDHWVCVCGNHAGADGLFFVNRSGADVGADGDAEAWRADGECYGCARCGRVGAQRERDALGRIPVITTSAVLPTGEVSEPMSVQDVTDPPADEPWVPHDEAEARGLCPQRTDEFNYWRDHDPLCNMHARWSLRWARDPDSMRTPSRS